MTTTFSITEVPMDILVNGIVPHLPFNARGAFRQTCKRMSKLPEPDLLELLKKHIPEFEKKDTSQSDLDAYKKRFVVHSNLRKGVCTIKVCEASDLKVSESRFCKPEALTILPDFWANSIQIHNYETNQLSELIPCAPSEVRPCVSMSHSYTVLFDFVGTMLIWDRQLAKMTRIKDACLNPDSWMLFQNNMLFLHTKDDLIKIWNIKTKSCTATLNLIKNQMYASLSFSGEKLFVTNKLYVHTLDFAATDIKVLKNIKHLLRSKNAQHIGENTVYRYYELPPKIIEGIQKILDIREESINTQPDFRKRLSKAIGKYLK